MLSWFLNLSIGNKLKLALLCAGLVPMGLIALIALNVARQQVTQQVYQQLEATRDNKAAAVNRYFDNAKKHIVSVAGSPSVTNAAGSFKRSFGRLAQAEGMETGDTSRLASLHQYYRDQFTAEYTKRNPGATVDAQSLFDSLSPAALAAQTLYIAENQHPLGEKHRLDSAEGRSVYHRTHANYHPGLRAYLGLFGYYDLFIADIDTGDVVYSVFKELDFGTSLLSGPFSDSSLAQVFKAARTLKHGQTIIQDYAPYLPSYNAPASFIATPIFFEGKAIAVLIFQMPLEPLNAIMNLRAGLGETGESYLVGDDFLMRSDSAQDGTEHSVAASFHRPETGSIKTPAVEAALAGGSEALIQHNYAGKEVLAAYAPLSVGGLNWAIVAEIESDEALGAVRALSTKIMILALVSAAALILLAMALSQFIAGPVIALCDEIQRLQHEGLFNVRISSRNTDEIGQINRALQSLLNNVAKVIGSTNTMLVNLAEGKITERLDSNYPGELGRLASGVNSAADKIQEARKAQDEATAQSQLSAERAEHAATEARAQSREVMKIKQALDASATAVIVTDERFIIDYQNAAFGKLLRTAEADIQQAVPDFSCEHFVRGAADALDPEALSHRDALRVHAASQHFELVVGTRHFLISASPIQDAAGEFLGAVIEWNDQTESLRQLQHEREIAQENLRIRQALDSSSTCTMITDEALQLMYVNRSFERLIRDAEAELKRDLPRLDAKRLLEHNIDVFYRDPDEQRQRLSTLESTYSDQVEAGGRVFNITANPIHDTQGARLGTVVEWVDLTAEVSIERDIQGIIDAAGQGDFSRSLDIEDKHGFFLRVSQGLNQLLQTTNVALQDALRLFAALSLGDLSQSIDRDYAGAFADLKRDANTTVAKLREILTGINAGSGEIARTTQEISAGNADLSQRTEEQASSLEETAAAMEEMTRMVQNSEDNARSANTVAQNSMMIAREGDQSVRQLTQAMSDIANASQKIANIIGVIDEIAFQTNLLALNAAVEAARAGDQGRGFAVVAGEVRNLAQRSAGAAREIKSLINDSVEKVQHGSTLAEHSGKTLATIVSEIEKVGTAMQDILTGAREQSTGIQQVSTAISQMDQITQQNAALVEQASASSESLADQAHQLDQLVGFFNVRR